MYFRLQYIFAYIYIYICRKAKTLTDLTIESLSIVIARTSVPALCDAICFGPGHDQPYATGDWHETSNSGGPMCKSNGILRRWQRMLQHVALVLSLTHDLTGQFLYYTRLARFCQVDLYLDAETIVWDRYRKWLAVLRYWNTWPIWPHLNGQIPGHTIVNNIR